MIYGGVTSCSLVEIIKISKDPAAFVFRIEHSDVQENNSIFANIETGCIASTQ
jgi:hypothetical protein